jgi:hypothetical protein
MLQPTVSWPVCIGIKHPSGSYDQIFITVRQLRVCWCGVLPMRRGWGLSFTIAAKPPQPSHSQVYILLFQSRNFPFFSPPGTHKVTMEVFNPTSTLDSLSLEQLNSDSRRYLSTWDQANSMGDNKKICNKNCDRARTYMEIGQKRR